MNFAYDLSAPKMENFENILASHKIYITWIASKDNDVLAEELDPPERTKYTVYLSSEPVKANLPIGSVHNRFGIISTVNYNLARKEATLLAAFLTIEGHEVFVGETIGEEVPLYEEYDLYLEKAGVVHAPKM